MEEDTTFAKRMKLLRRETTPITETLEKLLRNRGDKIITSSSSFSMLIPTAWSSAFLRFTFFS